MADREDIDALLVGALYGELDEPDRARLDAHLASHPQDRMALDAMKTTRGLLRDAQVSAAMVEPPAGVSALLLQEAARRAPHVRTAGAGGGILGFLAGLVRPMAAHPALAAAMTLVVVAGAAGALYLRGARPVQQERSMSSVSAPAATTTDFEGRVALDPGADTGSATGAFADGQRGDAVAVGAGRAAEPSLPTVPADMFDSYRVSLEDKDRRGSRELGAPARAAASDEGALAKGDQAEKRPAAGASSSYIEVPGGRPELALREADEPSAGPATRGQEQAQLGAARQQPAPARTATPSAGGAPGAASAPPPVAPMAPSAGDPFTGLASGDRAATGTGSSFSAPPPSSAAGGGSMADATSARPYDARIDAATLAWARDQHARMVKLVAAGKCSEVGPIGVALQKRAPDYYQDQVYNDRRVRACRPYVDKARRAAEPNRKRDLPSPAATESAAPDSND